MGCQLNLDSQTVEDKGITYQGQGTRISVKLSLVAYARIGLTWQK